ncbi:unnamed protein product [Prunus armeniaca]
MSQVKPELPKQLIPFPGHTSISIATPISVANRFFSLDSTVGQIRPSYQSTLISSYDPFSVDPSVGPSVAFKKTSPYLPKCNSHLFVIEPNYDVHSYPIAIAKHYFPPGFHYMPPSPYKSLKYYRDILLETQSVEIKPIKDRDHPETILYHSIYKVPWILKWPYKVTKDTRIFARQFSVKWWDKFEVDRIAKYVYNDLLHDFAPPPTSPTGSTKSSLSVEGKSKSDLQEIARQLIIQASQMDDDDEYDNDNDSPSSSSCQPMQSPAKPKSWYEDSQDSYDAYDLNSN